ncbi:hypothetical protein [Streptococcus oricebi]|uniref:Uncharacterized protein n=1 Tax=Streptococcus oricebi TaxID=1547447 RepID=A0ABS5B0V3_9STRE|nr:hypothetical protein [Streptococcus oricebi]MBP2622455.1 hypothetical protein [Streptococcus oricebi]
MLENLEKDSPSQEGLVEEILAVFGQEEELYQRRLWELDKHLSMHTSLYHKYQDFFLEMIKNLEELAKMQGQNYLESPQRQEHLEMLAEAEDKYQKNRTMLESEKYRLEEEQGYLRYRKEKFLMELKNK